MLLDNWYQEVDLIFDYTEPHVPHDAHPVLVGGQFTANSTVKVYKLGAQPVPGQALPPNALIATVNTTPDDALVPTILQYWHSAHAWLVADYHNGDGIYQPQLDAVAYHSFSKLGEPHLTSPSERPASPSQPVVAASSGVRVDSPFGRDARQPFVTPVDTRPLPARRPGTTRTLDHEHAPEATTPPRVTVTASARPALGTDGLALSGVRLTEPDALH